MGQKCWYNRQILFFCLFLDFLFFPFNFPRRKANSVEKWNHEGHSKREYFENGQSQYWQKRKRKREETMKKNISVKTNFDGIFEMMDWNCSSRRTVWIVIPSSNVKCNYKQINCNSEQSAKLGFSASASIAVVLKYRSGVMKKVIPNHLKLVSFYT